MKSIEYVIHDHTAKVSWILNSLSNHFDPVDIDLPEHKFFQVIFRSQTFTIARMDVECYAVVVNESRFFTDNLINVSTIIHEY